MMKNSATFLPVLFLCAAFGFLISAPAVHAQSVADQVNAVVQGNINTDAEEDAVADLADELLADATKDNVGALGTALIEAAEALGASDGLVEDIMSAVLDRAADLGLTQNEMSALQQSLADASNKSNADSLAQNAANKSGGDFGGQRQGSSASGDNPVSPGASAGGQQQVPPGCSPTDYACIAAALGITVDEARAQFPAVP